MTVALPTLGPPGVYLAPDLVAAAPLGVQMDCCVFVGVAPRGPAWERLDDTGFDDDLLAAGRAHSVPTAVTSWAEYTELFGAFEGPGLLPYAVADFFAQGGRRAYVQRVVPREPHPQSPAPTAGDSLLPASEPSACAVLAFDPAALRGAMQGSPDVAGAADPVRLRARNEGWWGNRLTASLSFSATALPPVPLVDGALDLVAGVSLSPGDVVRVRPAGGTVELREVVAVDPVPGGGRARLDRLVVGAYARVEVVTAALEVNDADPDHPRSERYADAGLRVGHPRWLGTLLAASRLVELAQVDDGAGHGTDLVAITPVDLALGAIDAAPGAAGYDRYPLLTPDDVVGSLDLLLTPRAGGADVAPSGLDALTRLVDPLDSRAPASVVVPDLYEPFDAPADVDVGVPASAAGATFDECVVVPAMPAAPPDTAGLLGLRLDPTIPGDRRRIIALQQRVVAAAEALGMVSLLDVPPGLRPAQVLSWRAAFDSSWAAAWHGWLRVPVGDVLVTVPPTGSAAGVIAATELRSGLPTGPAQVTLATAVAAAEGPGAGSTTADAATLHQLHRAGLNVALPDRDGVFFTSARTLSTDPQWRQLTARRVVTMVERSVASGLTWATFEPNDRSLRERISTAVEMLLLELFELGAFAGATPADSYFVRTAPPSPPGSPDESAVVCEIGVAPSEPLEFLLVRVLRADDGTLATQVTTGGAA